MASTLKKEKIIQRNILLAEHCSYKIGGRARFFAQPDSFNVLGDLIRYCQSSGLSFYVFGHGSNILFPDNPDQDTLFISLKNMVGWEETGEGLFLEAGFPLSYLAFSGHPELIFTHLLPGTLGAGVFINARCYDGEISRILNKVYYLDLEDFKGGIKEIPSKSCDFSYKKSVFQGRPWVVLGAEIKTGRSFPDWWKFEVEKLGQVNLASLSEFFQYFGKELLENINPGFKHKEKLQQIAADREGKRQFDFPSCGSVFKNNYEFGIPTGILVEKLGLKGFIRGGAKISPYHGNFIINYAGAKSGDVKYLIELVQERVNQEFCFIPEPEVVIVNGKPD